MFHATLLALALTSMPHLDVPVLHMASAASDGDSSSKSDNSNNINDDENDAHNWGIFAGTPVNGRAVHIEAGLPGIRGSYLFQTGTFMTGGGLEIDFPPLSLTGSQDRSAFNAFRFIGNVDVDSDLNDHLAVVFHFDPQYILVFGNNAVGGYFFMPLDVGAGLNLKVARLTVDAGIPIIFAGAFPFPFGSLGFASPFFGGGLEIPMGDDLVLTARVRAQTYFYSVSFYGSFVQEETKVSLAGLGFAFVGVAYRF